MAAAEPIHRGALGLYLPKPSIVFIREMNRVIVLLLVMGLVGCAQSLDIQLENEVSVFLSSDGDKQIRLTQNDKEYVELNDWLHDNRSEWYATSGRYAGGVYVKSGDYGIQVADNHVVIYLGSGSEAKAMYIQDIAKDELRGIKNIGR